MTDSKGAAIEKILLDFVRPKGQLIPYENGDREKAEMAGTLLNHWLDTEAKHLVQPAKKAILAILAQEVKRVIGEDDVAVYSSEEGIVHIKNKLRAAQRRKAGLV